MDNTGKRPAKSAKELAIEIYRKYGVKVTDMADRGVHAIGIVGGVRPQKSEQVKEQNPEDMSQRPS